MRMVYIVILCECMCVVMLASYWYIRTYVDITYVSILSGNKLHSQEILMHKKEEVILVDLLHT